MGMMHSITFRLFLALSGQSPIRHTANFSDYLRLFQIDYFDYAAVSSG